MKKASIVVTSYYQKNKLFDLDNAIANRDNCLYPFFLLRQKLLEQNIDLATEDIHFPENSDIVIYNEIPSVLPSNDAIQKSYLLLFESALIRPDNWDLENHKQFSKIFTWDDRFIDNKKYFKINFSHLFPEIINKDLSIKEKLCTLIAGNKKVSHPLELYSKRVEVIRWFEKHYPKDFDFYGMGWDEYTPKNRYLRFLFRKLKLSKLFKPNFPSYKGKVASKKEVLEKYKFAFCYENARDIPGYITEKIFDCLFAGCIPIYWGANNIIEHIPKECFIDKRDFKNYEELYTFMRDISNDDYLKYLEAIEKFLKSDKFYPFSSEYFAKTIVDTILDDTKNT